MRRVINIACSGTVDRIQCPNPDCEEILNIVDPLQEGRRKSTDLSCVCGDHIVVHITER